MVTSRSPQGAFSLATGYPPNSSTARSRGGRASYKLPAKTAIICHMVAPRQIAFNTFLYISALALQKVFSFVYFTILARYLGPADTGRYFYAVSLTFIITVFIDLGLANVLTREVAKFKEQGSRLLSQVATIKLLTSILIIVIAKLLLPYLTPDPLTQILFIVALAAMFMDGFTAIFYAAIRGFQTLKYESLATIIHQALVLISGLIMIKLGAPLRLVIFALVVGSIFNFIYSWAIVRLKLRLKLDFLFSKALIKSIALMTWPFALAAIFVRIYAYLDSILLGLLKGSEAVGYYAIAYKITFAFQFLPLAFVAALYPAFAYYWQHNKDLLYVTFSKSLQFLLIIAAPISAGLITLAPLIIPSLYTTAFAPAIQPLQILLSTLPLLFLNYPIGALLNACNRQGWQTTILGLGMVLNAVANLILIPLYGPLGAALASALGTTAIFIISISIASKVSAWDKRLLLTTVWKTALAIAALVLTLRFLSGYLSWYLTIVPGALAYLAVLLLSGLVKKEDWHSFRNSLSKRNT